MAKALALVLAEESEATRAGLSEISLGSPGRAAMLAAEGGVAIAKLVDEALETAPSMPIARAYEMADRLGRHEDGYGVFMELLRDRLGRSVREAARGRADRLARLRPLGEWGEVWHALGRLQDETERANLDKRHAVVAGLDLLNAR